MIVNFHYFLLAGRSGAMTEVNIRPKSTLRCPRINLRPDSAPRLVQGGVPRGGFAGGRIGLNLPLGYGATPTCEVSDGYHQV